MEKNKAEIQWNERITVERALEILCLSSVEAAKSYGLHGQAIGAWDANEREAYSAWGSLSDLVYGTSLTKSI